MIRGGQGGGDPSMEKEPVPLPVEAEEARSQLKLGQVLAIVLGAAFLALTAYMAYVVAVTPGFPYLFPALAMAYFGAAGASDLFVGLTSQKGAVSFWREGRFEEGDNYLRGWRRTLGFVPGGILPGLFLHRALERVHPLVLLEKGGMPPPRGAMAAPVAAPPYSSPYPSAGAPYAPGPGMPAPGPAPADNVAPDPFAGARSPPPTPAGAPPRGGAPYTPGARPSTYQTARSAMTASPPPMPVGPRACPACGATLEGDSRFCKHCGAAIS
ncbi:MAG: zinc ribbon domain-containing protein [Euryarchaeota archaeon]|nr:zinc ribbon domain-containing protein [Euryarchaeota archaeon]MDE2043518.1 zinc ribbon domain-containing protein [Thermoplasmata archaeon]